MFLLLLQTLNNVLDGVIIIRNYKTILIIFLNEIFYLSGCISCLKVKSPLESVCYTKKTPILVRIYIFIRIFLFSYYDC